MAVRLLAEGEHWGRLALDHTELVDKSVIVSDGIEEVKKIVLYVIACECGRKVKVFEHHFKGKRKMRDCGKCGLAALDKMPVRLNVYFPQKMLNKIRRYALGYGWEISDAVVRLVEGANHEWNWREWEVTDGLPEEVTRGMGIGEFKVHTTISAPQLLASKLAMARKHYNRSINQLVLGLVSRGLETGIKELQKLQSKADRAKSKKTQDSKDETQEAGYVAQIHRSQHVGVEGGLADVGESESL